MGYIHANRQTKKPIHCLFEILLNLATLGQRKFRAELSKLGAPGRGPLTWSKVILTFIGLNYMHRLPCVSIETSDIPNDPLLWAELHSLQKDMLKS